MPDASSDSPRSDAKERETSDPDASQRNNGSRADASLDEKATTGSPRTDGTSDSDAGNRQTDEVQLEPGSRSARLYELLAVDLWWSLGIMGVAGVAATALFIVTDLGPLRVAGIAVGLATALVYAGRLLWLRGAAETQADEWGVILAQSVALVAITEITARILDVIGGGLL